MVKASLKNDKDFETNEEMRRLEKGLQARNKSKEHWAKLNKNSIYDSKACIRPSISLRRIMQNNSVADSDGKLSNKVLRKSSFRTPAA